MVAQTKRDKSEERREKAAALRKVEQAKKRRNRILGIVIGVIGVAAGVALVIFLINLGGNTKPAAAGPQIVPAHVVGATTVEQAPKRVANTSGITGVLAYDTTGWPGDGTAHVGALAHNHVPGPVKYAVLPPNGGDHNIIWMNAGVYTKPVPSERAVHNLEHGAVWITYNPNLPAAEVKQLTAFVTEQSMIAEPATATGLSQSNRYMDLSPWASNALPSPIVVSSWGYQLHLTSATDPRLQQFVDKFRHNQTYSPEFGAAVDGVPVETGGRPALDGSKRPNPAGSAQ